MRQQIARLISNILNPFIISLITIILLVWYTTSSLASAFKWAAIALGLSVIPVFCFMVYQVRHNKLDTFFPEGQGQRKIIYVIASALAAIGCVVMWYFDAPRLLTFSFIAGLAAVVIFMGINLYWKISLHTAFISAAAVVLTLVFGVKAAWVFVLLPLVAFSRLELKLHTPAQVITGALLAAAIVTLVFWGFGVV
jgi:membrane-associated phospholipid phosphatase